MIQQNMTTEEFAVQRANTLMEAIITLMNEIDAKQKLLKQHRAELLKLSPLLPPEEHEIIDLKAREWERDREAS